MNLHSRPRNKTEFHAKFLTLFQQEKNGCFNFIGMLDKDGYGKLKFNYKNHRAHRVAWEIKNGAIPRGKVICHHCDNPRCVNTDHLFIGTPLINNLDKIRKGRDHNKKKTHCPKGHPYVGENLYVSSEGKRSCKECDRISKRKR